MAEQYRYSAYGKQTVLDGTGAVAGGSIFPVRFGFSGQWSSPALKLSHFPNRDYNPMLGRFLQRDPAGLLDGPNRYAYCHNDPVNFTDPDGRTAMGIYNGAAAGIGAIGTGATWTNNNVIKPVGTGIATAATWTGGKIGDGGIAAWKGTKWTGKKMIINPLLNTVDTGFEVVRSPIQSGIDIYSTITGDHPYATLNPFSREFIPYELSMGILTSGRLAEGIPFSILSGDYFDRAGYAPNNPSALSVNGVLTNWIDAQNMAKDVGTIMGTTSVYPVTNDTHFFGLGDILQCLGSELGAIMTPSIRCAEALREMSGIDVIAHSQGTAVLSGALMLIGDSERSTLDVQGFGGQRFLRADYLGLSAARNVVNPGDPVPYLSPWNYLLRIGSPGIERGTGTGGFLINHFFENYKQSVNP